MSEQRVEIRVEGSGRGLIWGTDTDVRKDQRNYSNPNHVLFKPRLHPYLSNTSHSIYHLPVFLLSSLLFFASSACSRSVCLHLSFLLLQQYHSSLSHIQVSSLLYPFILSHVPYFVILMQLLLFLPRPSILVSSSSVSTFFPTKQRNLLIARLHSPNNAECSMMYHVVIVHYPP